MKKSIKRLSAILAILVLSMTIAVPVTAVEYEIDPCAEFASSRLFSCEKSYYNDAEGCVVANAHARVFYNDTTKNYSGATTTWAEDGYEVDRYISAYVSGRMFAINGGQDVPFSDIAVSNEWWDIADAYADITLTDETVSVYTGFEADWESYSFMEEEFEYYY